MFYAITSKRKGCGRSTLALLSSIMVYNKTKGSTLLVDLGSNNDFASILNLKKPNSSIDNLISAISLQLDELDFENNIVHTGSFYLLPGTSIKQPRYLEKRCNDIVHLLKELESRFNTIILDVDYTLYGDLVDYGLDIVPIHVLEQNMLNVEGYHKDIQTQIFEGFYVINRYEPNVFPQMELFEKNFKKNSLICIARDNDLKSNLNRKKVDMGMIKGSKAFSGVSQLADIISDNLNVIEKQFSDKHVKTEVGFFAKLFGKKSKPSPAPNKPKQAATKAVKRTRSNNGKPSNGNRPNGSPINKNQRKGD